MIFYILPLLFWPNENTGIIQLCIIVRMGAAKGGMVVLAVIAIAGAIINWWFASPKQKETEPSSPQQQTRRYSNPNNNNHDHVNRFNHSARVSAEAEELGRMKKSTSRYDECYRSNPRNNHDQHKVKHSTRASAEVEIRRMKESGRDECERLNVYYNDEYEGWFIGRGWSEHSD